MNAVFCWILVARSRLNTARFIDAISATVGHDLDVSREIVLDLCFNLVIIDKALDVFRFAHLSVQEYIEMKSEYEISQAHATVAKISLSYLAANSLFSTRVQHYTEGIPSFYFYAGCFWHDHLQRAGEKGHSRPVLDAFFEFCTHGYLPWTKFIGQISEPPMAHGSLARVNGERLSLNDLRLSGDSSPIYLAAALGIWEIFELETYNNLKCFNRYSYGPLTIACTFNQKETAEWMLNHGADPNEQNGPFDYFPLAAAAARGSCKLAELLINNGALVRSRTDNNGRALCNAIGKNDLEMATLLLKNGIDVHTESIYLTSQDLKETYAREPPLFYAGERDTIEFLLERGASPYQKDHNGLNVLEHATCLGFELRFDYWIDKYTFELNDSLLSLVIKSLIDDPTFTHMLRRLLEKDVVIELDLCRRSIAEHRDPKLARWVVSTLYMERELKLQCSRYTGIWELECDGCNSSISYGTYMRKHLLSNISWQTSHIDF